MDDETKRRIEALADSFRQHMRECFREQMARFDRLDACFDRMELVDGRNSAVIEASIERMDQLLLEQQGRRLDALERRVRKLEQRDRPS